MLVGVLEQEQGQVMLVQVQVEVEAEECMETLGAPSGSASM